ncbi:otogelin-like [Dendrobates tinctorius]|uniref:otogelin-like n=1 Tax=Dendrobates tinctorius TaxID=92724 RepID=UPI003CC92F54
MSPVFSVSSESFTYTLYDMTRLSCQDTMVYSACVSPCARTCLSLSVQEACDGACVEGCACPENMYYNTQLSSCVQRNQCPCYFQGIDYHPGEKVVTSLGKCLCLDGVMKCESSQKVHGCPSGQIYHNCSSPDMDTDLSQDKTCENQLLNVSAPSNLPCVSGCVCPRGWVKHGAECLQPDACPCSWKAKDYYPGDIVQSACYTCVCHHGAFQCSFHPCPSMCTFYGDRHFRTFDGFTFDFVGACKVHLVKARIGNFSVTAENVKCYSVGVVCRKVISISVGRSLILLDDHTGSLSPSSVIDKGQEVHVWQAGFFTFVHFPSEYITLLWDQRTTLHIQAGPQWQGALEGLCGNFDLKTVNEMRTPDDLEVSNPQEFGTSWTIAECLDRPDSRSPCHLNPLRELFAKKECGILLSEVFEACHPVLDVTWFYTNCLSDTCGCNLGGDCECFCASVSAYAHQCCQQGITVDWRSPRVCPYDCEFYNKVLGKGPYRLHSHRDQGLVLAVQMADIIVMPMREASEMPGHTADFMMTPGLFSPKAHDINLVSLELAVRPNFFLHLGSNGTFHVSKWQRSEDFQRRSTFIIHKNRWTAGYSAFESFAQPGHFMRISPSSISLTKYHHSTAFRLSTLYRISDSKLHVMPRSTCEWRYDACSSACYRTCRDPTGNRCHSIPRVEGCFPLCPPHMVVDEVSKKCVYFSDCIEPAVNVTMFHIITEHPRGTAIMNVTTLPAQRVSGDQSVAGHIFRPVSPTISAASYSSDAFHSTMHSDESTKLKTDTVYALTPSDSLRTMAGITLAKLASPGSTTQSTPAASTQFSPISVTRTVTSMSPAPGTIPSKVMSIPTTLLTEAPQNVTTSAGSLGTVLQISEAVTQQDQRMLESAKFSTSPSSTFESIEPYTGTEQPDLAASPPLSLPTTTTVYTLVFTPLDKVTTAFQTGITSKPAETIKFSKDTRQTTVMSTKKVTVKEVSHAKILTVTIGGITQISGALSSLSQKFTEATTEVPEVFTVLPLTTSLLESMSGYHPSRSRGLGTTSIVTNQPTSERVTMSTQPSTMATAVTPEEASSTPHTLPSERTRLAPILSASSQAESASKHTIRVLTKQERTQSQSLEDVTSEAANTTITTKMISWTSSRPKAEHTTAVTSLGTGISTPQMSSRTEPKNMTESTTLVLDLRDLTGPIKSTINTGGALSSSDVPVHETKVTSTQETALRTSHPELTGLASLRTSSSSVTMMQELSVTPMSTSTMTLPVPVSGHSLLYTSRTTQPTSPATLSPMVSHFGPLVSTHKEEKGLMPYTYIITSSTPVPSSQHSVTSPVHMETSSISKEHTGTIFTSDASTTEQRDLSSSKASNATGHVTSASQLLVVYETAAYLPSAKAWPSITQDKQSSVVSGPAAPSFTKHHPSVITTSLSVSSTPLTSHTPVREQTVVTSGMGTKKPPSTSQKEPKYSTWTEASHSALQPGPPTSSLGKATYVSVTPLLLTHDIHTDGSDVQTAPPSPSITNRPQYRLPPMTEATSPHLLMMTSSRAFNQTETPGISAELTVSMLSTSQTCTPYTENECIKHICVDGQLIQVNKSQHCPYNVTQSSCGLLGFAVQINGDKCCPKWECPCRCSILSDLSFVTFDGRYLALYNEASYIMTLTEEESITVQVSQCLSLSMGHLNWIPLCLSVLELTYEANQIIIDRLRRKVVVNSRNAWPIVRKYGYKIVDTGNMYLIDTPSDVQIQWFHSTGLMIIESNSTSKPSSMGLCGFCDGNATNDFILPNGRVLFLDDDPEEFLDSWQVPYTLKYVGKERFRDVNCTVVDCSECMWMILNQTFSSCHPYVSPEAFCELWAQDAEYTRDPCKALTAYSTMCHKFNICIDWRRPDFCPFLCPPSLIYRACLPICAIPLTCQNHEIEVYGRQTCAALTEGCVCAEGELLHRPDSTMCISGRKCACTDALGTPREIGEVWQTSETGCCAYRCVENDTIMPVQYNCSKMDELQCRRHGQVLVTVTREQTCCPQKLCVCNETLCDGLIPPCRSHEKLTAYYQDDSCCPRYICECDPEKCERVDGPPPCRQDQTLFAAVHTRESCCVRYFCGCNVCSDPAPTCQQGEFLTVSSNTTGRCCPRYQCVCDPSQCPDITCDLGMSAVEIWTPDSCCPYKTCECSCGRVQKPDCDVGEILEVDSKLSNSPGNLCNCTMHKCVKDTVCLSKENGILRPGQTVVQHTAEGLCHSSHCTSAIDPVTRYHLINVSSLNCAAKCEANQLYEPPRDMTQCCGRCRNVSCVQTFLNGTVLTQRPGSTWISKCVRYDCTNTPIGPVLVTSAISCPPFNETECIKMGGHVVSFLDGCCKTCKEDGKFCKRVTVRMTIRKNDCRSNTPVNIVSCDGKCPSASIYNYNINTYARFCKCCRELGLQRRIVQLYCSGNSTWVHYAIQEPTDCSCQWS